MNNILFKVLLLKGENGNSIASIEKTSTSGLKDTYTITLTDGSTTTFEVENGKGISSIAKTDTSGLVDTYTITYSDNTTSTFTVTNGADGADGADGVGIASIAKTSTSGNVDTYTITLTNGATSTFTVTNGTNGITINSNLLINPWFTVNQRDFTTDTLASLAYTVDRWQAKGTATISTTGLTIAPNGNNAELVQKFDTDETANLQNKTLTLSVMLSNGSIVSGNVTTGDLSTESTFFDDSTVTGMVATIGLDGNNYAYVKITASSSVTIRAVKLERGTETTIAYDMPPVYSEELAKCQRYYFEIVRKTGNYIAYIGRFFVHQVNELWFDFKFPVPMRVRPTLSFSGITAYGDANTSNVAITAIDQPRWAKNSTATFMMATPASSQTVGKMFEVALDNGGGYLKFDAEIH